VAVVDTGVNMAYLNSQGRARASTAEDLGVSGYDYQHGYGVVDACALGKKLCGLWWFDICKVHPWICKGVFRWPEIPGPAPVIRWFDIPDVPFKIPRVVRARPGEPPRAADDEHIETLIDQLAERSGVTDAVQLGYIIGVLHAQMMNLSPGGGAGTESVDGSDLPPKSNGGSHGGCGCGSAG
jgi:hypothetical protein